GHGPGVRNLLRRAGGVDTERFGRAGHRGRDPGAPGGDRRGAAPGGEAAAGGGRWGAGGGVRPGVPGGRRTWLIEAGTAAPSLDALVAEGAGIGEADLAQRRVSAGARHRHHILDTPGTSTPPTR